MSRADMKNYFPFLSVATILILAAALVLVFTALTAWQPVPGCADVYTPSFISPETKLAILNAPDFSYRLFAQEVAYEPLLNRSGTQVHMAYWSGLDNHGSLVQLVDSINFGPRKPGDPPQKALWAGGPQSLLQIPLYVDMNAREHWYERAAPSQGNVLIYGVNYTDPYPVTFAQADDVWGAYSMKYSEMARILRNATGEPVQAWCFVNGAKANRIFYKYELPALAELEREGVVVVHFAKNRSADWKNPEDWIVGTGNAPAPAN